MSKMLSPREVASRLSVHIETVRLWMREGKLKASKLGPRMWRIREKDLEKFIEKRANFLEEDNPESE